MNLNFALHLAVQVPPHPSLQWYQKKPSKTHGVNEIQSLHHIIQKCPGFNPKSLTPRTRKNQEALKPIERRLSVDSNAMDTEVLKLSEKS